MTVMKRRLIVALVGIGLTLVVAGAVPLLVSAQEATPEATVEVAVPEATEEAAPAARPVLPMEVMLDEKNSYCAICHLQPDRSVTLPDGSVKSLYANPLEIAASVHGVNSENPLGCLDCHGENAFPHSGPSPAGARPSTINAVEICTECHTNQHEVLQTGLHAEAIRAGNLEAAVCTDCHGAHDVRPALQARTLTASVCGECHTQTLVEWQASPHGDMGPLGCGSCHSPHTQVLRTGSNSTQLCINCHKVLPDQWVHAQHITVGSPVECADCHMYVPQTQTVASAPLGTGHTMEVTTIPCSSCHEERSLQAVASGQTGSSATATVTPASVEEVSTRGSETGITQLLQGLILGLGFGVTGAAVFLTRGNRRPY